MSSITVTTQAGNHNSHNHNTKGSEPNTDPVLWIIVGTIIGVILVRGLIKTFK
jgi:hypothetical protein